MKRAAVQWGMGRYLYNLTENMASECTLERRRGPEWHTAVTKDKQSISWKAPALPDWALPAVSGASGTGKAPAGKTTRPASKPTAQAPAQAGNQPTQTPQKRQNPVTPEEKAKMMLGFMHPYGVEREEIEAAVGARVEEFTNEETAIIREAAKIMKHDSKNFQDAFHEVTR